MAGRFARIAPQGWLRRPRIAIVTGAVVFLLVASTLLFRPQPTLHMPQRPIRIMVVGDSISHGWEGDYTWRYRLWEWFRSNSVPVDFVGPFTGTKSPEPRPAAVVGFQDPDGTPAPDIDMSGGYAADASPDFDPDHFALWGRHLSQDRDEIGAQVRNYKPDYLLVELGYNDLLWHGPEDTLSFMKSLVDRARDASPELRFAIANVPHSAVTEDQVQLLIKADQYNTLLADAVAMWNSHESPVELVRFRESYSCESNGCPAGHDMVHPNALGEYQIAAAFSLALHKRFGLGRRPLSVPKRLPRRPCPTPANLGAVPDQKATNVSWDPVYGAFGYQIQTRWAGSEWSQYHFSCERSHYETAWTVDGHQWEFRVRTVCGDGEKQQSEWSGSVFEHR